MKTKTIEIHLLEAEINKIRNILAPISRRFRSIQFGLNVPHRGGGRWYRGKGTSEIEISFSPFCGVAEIKNNFPDTIGLMAGLGYELEAHLKEEAVFCKKVD